MISRASSGHRCGQSHQKAKLTDEQVIEMRRLNGEGTGYRKLAKLFGCGQSTACDVCTYRTRYSA